MSSGANRQADINWTRREYFCTDILCKQDLVCEALLNVFTSFPRFSTDTFMPQASKYSLKKEQPNKQTKNPAKSINNSQDSWNYVVSALVVWCGEHLLEGEEISEVP